MGTNPHGTRVIQKIIECINSKGLLDYFTKVFRPCVVGLMKDINGNHIIIKFINVIKYPNNQFVYDVIINQFLDLSTDKHGCCVIQKCIDCATSSQKQMLIKKIVENTYTLMCDAYGNYVMQYIINLKDYKVNYMIACYFLKNIVYLSKQKFSSNVIEKVKIIFNFLLVL